MTKMTATEQVALLDRYQRDCWQMHWADAQFGYHGYDDDPTERNYWLVLPAERVHADWQHIELDATCLHCGEDYRAHGWGDGLDRCEAGR